MAESIFLETATQAVRAAARVALDRFGMPQTITRKGFRDIVTESDVAAQTAAVTAIRARFPDAAILGEENLTPSHDAETVWVIDPIDGTTNYSRQFPAFGVSIGVVRLGRPVAGVVYDPLRHHLFAAERELGARLNGSPIHVSDVRTLSDAILALDWSHAPDDRHRSLVLLQHLATECRSVRAIGSAVLAMCYLAAGWVDLFFNLALKPWDGAATQVIVEEAGGCITNRHGEAWDYTQPSAFASNGHLHAAFDAFRAIE